MIEIIVAIIAGLFGLGSVVLAWLLGRKVPVEYQIFIWAFVVFVVVFAINSIVKWFKKDKK